MTFMALINHFEQRVRGIGGIHHEPYGPIDAGHDQEAIDERHMVRDEKRSAGLGICCWPTMRRR